MSYQVIARKWRPQAFDEVTGQEHITQTLRNAIEHGRLHHAYLFSGARGVGKTTTARLLAKALNCHKTEKPTVSPCRVDDPEACPSCREITESRSIDVLEFDAASNTQVDKIRDIILENINIAPARDRCKIFIIDEVHMLSGSSFNALLKTVEEPPPGVVFIMATTELQKVPDTITSRCQEFQFRTIPQQKIYERLRSIADAEKIDADDAALREIARSGEGSMRDAQSNFDQVISFSDGKVSAADVSNALGIASIDILIATIKAIASNEPRRMIEIVGELDARGQDLRSFCRDLLALLRDMMVAKIAGDAEGVLDNAVIRRDELVGLGIDLSESDVLRLFNSLAATESKLKDASNPRFALEIGLVKLVEMRRIVPIETLIDRLNELTMGSVPADARLASPAGPETRAAAAAEEKKTLDSEPPPLSDWPESVSSVIHAEPEDLVFADPEADTVPISAKRPAIDLSFIENLPSKLPPLTPDDLAHTDDAWLDDAYEQALTTSGDDLMPIASAVEFARAFAEPHAAAHAAAGSGSNMVKTSELSFIPPRRDDSDDDTMPVTELSADPTDEELLEYARQLPTVRRVTRIFRAEIVGIEKRK